MNKVKSRWGTFSRFCTVGIGNTLIDYCTFFLLVNVGFSYLFAQIFAYSAGMVNSYIWNRLWTFHWSQKVSVQEIIRFGTINLVSSFVGYIFLIMFYEEFDLSLFWSKGMATLGGLVINFIGSRLWVFKEVERKSRLHES